MRFNSLAFLIFLPLVVILYYLIPGKYRWIMLLGASYLFYGYWKVEFLGLIVFSTLLDYVMGLAMDKIESRKKKLPYLIISLVTNLGLLGVFKYADFLTGSINEISGTQIPALDLLLPVGISFYTFQTLSYSVDIYKGNQRAERHLGYFALYVTFFPQLVAGPIERFSELGPQLREKQSLSYDNLAAGFRLVLLGFFAKIAIADNLAIIAESFYKDPSQFARRDAILAVLAYAFQIYGDFLGYSLIAIGSARLIGIKLMDNFKTPYLASSVAEFWQRWHISLSTWFRDYVFIPLGGSRVNAARLAFNILVIFTVSGLWHGARWTFVIWGGIWGLLYLIERALDRFLPWKNPKAWSIGHLLRAATVFGIACIAWIPFRSNSLAQMMEVLDTLLLPSRNPAKLGMPLVVKVMVFIFLLIEIWLYNKDITNNFKKLPMPIRWGIYTVLLFCITAFGAVEDVPFIYFQF